ncbi:hypothetical protein PoB_001093400 [Plakobranchus ocellatus]|uniref:Uncharacterized protein n=1 Tax=Plakobranchus ocellatus TaxID=259542 RepID=A0AAV3YQX7_9GAST|nr:hypothetical protein PoB_001093400 [Plakobranchus ocellatus]
MGKPGRVLLGSHRHGGGTAADVGVVGEGGITAAYRVGDGAAEVGGGRSSSSSSGRGGSSAADVSCTEAFFVVANAAAVLIVVAEMLVVLEGVVSDTLGMSWG